MQKNLNLKIKFESFRPFAPSIIAEKLNDWFQIDASSPYMLLIGYIKESLREKIKKMKKSIWNRSVEC